MAYACRMEAKTTLPAVAAPSKRPCLSENVSLEPLSAKGTSMYTQRMSQKQWLFGLLLGMSFLPGQAGAVSYFVSPSGSDGNSGTSTAPFRTIGKAASVAVAGDVVEIRAGTYREEVVPANSGTADKPILYRAYNNEVVTISGAEGVTGWTQVSSTIWSAPMSGNFFEPAFNQSAQLFVDGHMMNLARWPNTAFNSSSNMAASSTPTKSSITQFISKTRDESTGWTTAVFEDANLTPALDGYYVGAEVVIQPNKDAWSWTLSGVVVEQVGTRLTIQSRSDSGMDGNSAVYAVGSRYYLHNQAELLDSAGEWFHDEAAGMVYLWTPAGDSPNLHTIESKKRELCFNLSNRSYIILQKLNLFGCYITTDDTSGGDGIGYDENGQVRYPWHGAGWDAPAHHILMDRINATYLSHFTDMSGHFYLQHGQHAGMVLSGSDLILQNSTLRYSAGNGVVVLGRRNKVLNNSISDVSYQQVDGAAINTGGSADTFDHEFAYNTIRRTGRSGILLRKLANSDPNNLVTRIHHNDIGNIMLQDWDGGCIYMAYQDAAFTRIDHNLCHDGIGFTVSGIYSDFVKNLIIDHNVIWNVEWGIHLQGDYGGVGNALVYNNTIAVKNTSNTPYGPFGLGNNWGSQAGTLAQNNVFYVYMPSGNGYAAVSSNFDGASFNANLSWDRVTGSSTDPQFTNTSTFDFSLKSSSPAINTGSLVGSEWRDGIYVPAFNDPVNGSAPEKGAYEYGVTKWTGGTTTTFKPVAPTGLSATPKAASVSLTWNPVPNAVTYNLKRALSSSGPFSNVLTGLTKPSATNTSLTNGTLYYFVVSAVHANGEGPVSSVVSATPMPAPAAPTSLVAVAGAGTVSLTWSQASSGITQNKVWRAPKGGAYQVLATLSPSTSFVDTGLSKGQAFYYRVTALNSYGESTNSNTVSATVK